MVNIVKYPDPILKKESRNVNVYDIDEGFIKQVASMFEIMKQNRGAGLSAPQVGDLRRFFLLGIPEIVERKGKQVTEVNQFELCINPEILEESVEDIAMTEGCLSLPGITDIPIYRSQRIMVRYQNIEFSNIEVELDGWAARIFQHELDHLNGKLFIHRMNFNQKISVAPKLEILRKAWAEESANEV